MKLPVAARARFSARQAILACAIATSALCASASAQCLGWSQQFSPTFGTTPLALRSYDDGAGAALYVGSYGVQRWTGGSWLDLTGLSGTVDASVGALCEYDDGSGPALYAGGDFEYAGSSSSPGIAKWTGASWNPVGQGLWSNEGALWVSAATVFDDGGGPALFLGGRFTAAPGFVTSHGIIKWDGSTWSGLAGGISGYPTGQPPVVFALTEFDDGSGPALYAGGTFTSIGGVAANRIAKWNGTAWSALGTGVDGWVYSMAVYNDGTGSALYALGSFSSAGGVSTHGPARWDGTSWSAVGTNTTLTGGYALAVFDDGSGSALYAACDGYAAGGWMRNVCRWDGVSWTSLGGGVDGDVRAMAVHDDGAGVGPQLYVAGSFHSVGDGIPSDEVAEWMGCHIQVATVCVGDGTYAPCPCGNHGLAGRGCENSTGSGGAMLNSTGTTIPDTFTLISSYEPASAISVFVMGDALTGTPLMFGDGIRCAGGNLLRMYVHAAVGGSAYGPQPGDPSVSQRAANLGFPIPPGSVRYFQTYYRDGLASFCPPPNGSSFNISNALRVIW
jgi:hypothetical protein